MALAPGLHQLYFLWGERIRWWRSLGRCPCYNPVNGVWDKTHSLCSGTGILREEVPLLSTPKNEYRVILTSASTMKSYLSPPGQIEVGEMVCSFWQNEIPLAEGDVILPISRSASFEEQVVHGTGSSDSLKHTTVSSIQSIYNISGPLVTGYSLQNSIITWNTGILTTGDKYSVRYTYSPLYIVLEGNFLLRRPDFPTDQFRNYTSIPSRVLLKEWNVSSLDFGANP